MFLYATRMLFFALSPSFYTIKDIILCSSCLPSSPLLESFKKLSVLHKDCKNALIFSGSIPHFSNSTYTVPKTFFNCKIIEKVPVYLGKHQLPQCFIYQISNVLFFSYELCYGFCLANVLYCNFCLLLKQCSSSTESASLVWYLSYF